MTSVPVIYSITWPLRSHWMKKCVTYAFAKQLGIDPDIGSPKKYNIYATYIPSSIYLQYDILKSANVDNVYVGNNKSVANNGQYIGQILVHTLKKCLTLWSMMVWTSRGEKATERYRTHMNKMYNRVKTAIVVQGTALIIPCCLTSHTSYEYMYSSFNPEQQKLHLVGLKP